MSSQLVVYKHNKKLSFEIITYNGTVRKFKNNQLGWDKVLQTDLIFTNSKKGNRASSKDLKTAFGTDDLNECAKLIVEKGELQVSAKERKEDTKTKKNEIIYYIHKNYIDPKSKLPHPMSRLELAIDNLKYRIDTKRLTEQQANEIIKKLQGKLFFKKSLIEMKVSMEHRYIGQCSNVIYGMTNVIKERITSDGYEWKVSISSSDFDSFIEKLTKLTSGHFEMTKMS
jgi:ribosome maturation protein SDO1